MPTTYTDVAEAIAWRVIDGEIDGHMADDAGEWFDDETVAGFHLAIALTAGPLRGEPDMGRIDGEIVVTDPTGTVARFAVATSRFGDVEVARV